jgi:hypothetical protein
MTATEARTLPGPVFLTPPNRNTFGEIRALVAFRIAPEGLCLRGRCEGGRGARTPLEGFQSLWWLKLAQARQLELGRKARSACHRLNDQLESIRRHAGECDVPSL